MVRKRGMHKGFFQKMAARDCVDGWLCSGYVGHFAWIV